MGESGLAGFSPLGVMYLSEAARWARFLAIVGFVIAGMIVIGGLAQGVSAGISFRFSFPFYFRAGTVGLPSLFVVILYLISSLLLYRFSSHARMAIALQNSYMMEAALKSIKSFFKFLGIVMIVLLCIYVVTFINRGAPDVIRAFPMV